MGHFFQRGTFSLDGKNVTMKPFSVFIPVYNEEAIIVQNVERLLSYLNGLNVAYEVIIGSNGSTDQTVSLGESLARQYPHVLFFHIPQKAPGTAFKQGVQRASYDHILSVDMDLSVELDFIPRANLLLSDYALVVGSKRMSRQRRSFVRRFVSAIYIFCCMILLSLSFDDYSLAAKGYTKRILSGCLDSLDRGTFYVIQILYHASLKNVLVAQIPAACEDNRKSHFNLIHEGVYRFGRLFLFWLKG
jgi:glycosyltransferase involved in cell wall biosynthesis